MLKTCYAYPNSVKQVACIIYLTYYYIIYPSVNIHELQTQKML